MVAVILCGGKSSRMGSDKAGLLVFGKPLLQRKIEALLACRDKYGNPLFEEICISSGSRDYQGMIDQACGMSYDSNKVFQVQDIYEDCGPLGGMHAVFSHYKNASEDKLLFFTTVDAPEANGNLANALLMDMSESSFASEDFDGIVPVDESKKVHILCAIYKNRLLAKLDNALEQKQYKVRTILESCALKKVALANGYFENLNSPEAFMGYLAMKRLNTLVDLHLHLDGAISTASAKDLAQLQGIQIPNSDAEIEAKMQVSKDCSDLNEFLEKFDFPCMLLQTEAGIQRAVENLLAELEENGVMYAEIRFAPQKSVDAGLTQEQAVLAALRGIENAKLSANLILCCMRGMGNEKENLLTLEVAQKYAQKGVCAVDLAGAEALFPTRNFKELFEQAKKLGLKFTIHAGEADGPESIWDAISFGANRIGHGIRAVEDDKLMDYLAKEKLPLELCPTSNVCTAVYPNLSEYPLRKLLDRGIVVTINTDDPAIENIILREEYEKLIALFSLSSSEVYALIKNSIEASFADEDTKRNMRLRLCNEFGAEDNEA